MLSRRWQQLASEQKLTFEIIFSPFGLIKHQSVGSLLEMDTTGVILGGLKMIIQLVETTKLWLSINILKLCKLFFQYFSKYYQ